MKKGLQPRTDAELQKLNKIRQIELSQRNVSIGSNPGTSGAIIPASVSQRRPLRIIDDDSDNSILDETTEGNVQSKSIDKVDMDKLIAFMKTGRLVCSSHFFSNN